MKKIYFILVGICAIIFIYWLSKEIPVFSTKLITVTSVSLNESSFSSTGTFGFKSTSEKTDLLIGMLKINSSFIKEPPIKSNSSDNETISNFYRVERFFNDFKSYYIANSKIRDVIFSELSTLYNSTYSLSNIELEKHFNNNTPYLKEKWGINDLEDFFRIVSDIKVINGQKVISCELEDSYFYMPNLDLLNIRLILTLEDSSFMYLNAQIKIHEGNDYQSAPLIRFMGAQGGTSYV